MIDSTQRQNWAGGFGHIGLANQTNEQRKETMVTRLVKLVISMTVLALLGTASPALPGVPPDTNVDDIKPGCTIKAVLGIDGARNDRHRNGDPTSG